MTPFDLVTLRLTKSRHLPTANFNGRNFCAFGNFCYFTESYTRISLKSISAMIEKIARFSDPKSELIYKFFMFKLDENFRCDKCDNLASPID